MIRIVAAGVTGLFLLLLASMLIRQWVRRARRGEASETDFVKAYSGIDVPVRVLREVHRFLSGGSIVRARVLKDDDLASVYGLSDEDLDDAVVVLAERCGYALPARESMARHSPVRTVGDLVLLVAALQNTRSKSGEAKGDDQV